MLDPEIDASLGYSIWPNIRKNFENLLKKLSEANPAKIQLAVVDWWIGRLFLVRAAIASGKWPPKEK